MEHRSAEQLRRRFRAFTDVHAPGPRPRDRREALAWQRAWLATLFDHGWAGPSWPREWGGMDLPLDLQIAYHEEYGRASLPRSLGTGPNIAAPTIIRYGTPDQRARWLRPMLRGDTIWAQGFSEPDAGSDLPSLRTTATRDGDSYVVNGTKVWSTAGEIADHVFALVRTGAPNSRERGITYLVIEVDTPGVDRRPIRDLTGRSNFAEWQFVDVRVPLANRIGKEHDGWQIARTTLGHERAATALAGVAAYRRVVDELMLLARERGVVADPRWRQRLAQVETELRVGWLGSIRQIDNITRNGEPGATSSVNRLSFALFEQRLHETAVDLLGAVGGLSPRDPHSVQGGRWVWGFLRTRASTIGAGTAEIQRNTIAERVLGLPGEPSGRPDRRRDERSTA